jgi:predicted dinucleotide-binding enzyme
MMGSRSATHDKALEWAKGTHGKGSVGTFADTARFGELLFNCVSGVASLEALKAAGEANLGSKVLVDISNPLDFSKGMPPTLTVTNTDSLGEQIQRAFPTLRVVKALNTVNAGLMVEPVAVANGAHDLFMCGNDPDAKKKVLELLNSFGWKTVHDLGDITNARATEGLLPLWVRLFGAFQSPQFNFRVVR